MFFRKVKFPYFEAISNTISVSIEDAMKGCPKEFYLRTKEEWEPYLTPDRELVKYEEGKNE